MVVGSLDGFTAGTATLATQVGAGAFENCSAPYTLAYCWLAAGGGLSADAKQAARHHAPTAAITGRGRIDHRNFEDIGHHPCLYGTAGY
jgi:hypothetical protein